jgi:hypothetical protein
MLDRGRQRRGGDPYDAAGRRAVVTAALAGTALLLLVAMRAGYLSAKAMRWPAWPVAIGCALVALTLPVLTFWVLSRDR